MIRFRRQRLAREAIMAAKEISVKKYVVTPIIKKAGVSAD